MTPAEQHRHDLEAEIFGQAASRHNGTVERGSGSQFSALPEASRRKIELADALIAAEKAEKAAADELHNATVKHDQTITALARAAVAAGADGFG